MKKLTLLLLLFSALTARGQDYIPMAVEDAHWLIMKFNPDIPMEPDGYYAYYIKGDTVINELTYKKVYRQEFEFTTVPPLTIIDEYLYAGLRDDIDSRQVYAYVFDENEILCPIETDYLQYDFSVEIGEAYNTCAVQNYELIVTNIYNDQVYGINTRIIECENDMNYFHLYEGIGCISGLFEMEYRFLEDFCIGENCMDDYILHRSKINAATDGFRIAPNPVKTVFTFEVLNNRSVDRLKLQLADLSGKPVYTNTIASHTKLIDISALPPGMYILTVYAQNTLICTQKIIKL